MLMIPTLCIMSAHLHLPKLESLLPEAAADRLRTMTQHQLDSWLVTLVGHLEYRVSSLSIV